jgi:outer membrane receptor for ferrienterochelin and colicin
MRNTFKQKVITLIGLIITTHSIAQVGSITGTVYDKTHNESLVGATIIIEGTTLGTTTDLDGHFEINNLKPGHYNLSVSFISYEPKVVQNILVEPNKKVKLYIELEEVTTPIEGVTVTATRKTNTDVAMRSTIKSSLSVANGISAQQISRSQDRDASEVIRRIPGVSIIDNRFVVVRGLNQRYNNAWLNNSSTPSSEADQKAFSFDVIPSSMIDNVLIYKSPSPEIPADFTGGFIKIFTKNMPSEDYLSIGYSTGINTSTNLNSFKQITTSKTDWLGFDDGTRNLPQNFPSSLKGLSNSQLAEYGKMLNTSWNPHVTTAIPEQKFNITFGKKWQKGNRQIGNITSISYSNNHQTEDIAHKEYQVQLTPGELPPINHSYTDSVFIRSAKIGILHNWTLLTGKNTKIEFRNLFNLIGKSSILIRNGFNGHEGFTIRSYQDYFQNRTTYSSQLAGERKWGENLTSKIDWVIGYALSYKNEPDMKQLRTTLQDEPLLPHYNEYYAAVGLTPSVSDAGRSFLKLIEHTSSIGINYEQKLDLNGWQPTIKGGIYGEFKTRSFNARILGFAKNSSYTESVWLPTSQIFSLENINTSPDGFILKESTSKSDSYDVNSILGATYFALNTNITKKLSFYGGIRAELVNQKLNSYNRYGLPLTVNDNKIDVFPSANLTYNLNDRNLLRLAAGISINRPEFREIAPFYFYNFNDEAEYVGNSDLKSCLVNNFDLRWEQYPNTCEFFSIGLFYKKFSAPIELVFKPAGARPLFTYDNAESAYSIGAEIELRKSLKIISLLKDFYISMNAALIHSRVQFPKESIFRERPMQGQSPYLVNAGIFYQNEENKLNIAIQYNVIGDRILAVGIPFQNEEQDIPDYYEKHQHMLDLTISKTFANNIEVKAGVKNLLNQKFNIYQKFKGENNTDMDLSNKQYKEGLSFSIGSNYKF